MRELVMNNEGFDIFNNIVQAISLLNDTESYMEGINERQSDFDLLNSAFYHFIEMTPIEKVDLKELYIAMQENLQKRRMLKQQQALQKKYLDNIGKLNNKINREFLVAELKKVQNKSLDFEEYGNADKEKLLSQDILERILKKEKKKVGRPKKIDLD